MPQLIYGTAWKKERTEALVTQALRAGFRGIDTACQPKHYHEPGVGAALAASLRGGLTREQIYLQTKFTRCRGRIRNAFLTMRTPASRRRWRSPSQYHCEICRRAISMRWFCIRRYARGGDAAGVDCDGDARGRGRRQAHRHQQLLQPEDA